MMMLEHEAKRLLASVGVPVPEGKVVASPRDAASGIAAYPVAVKAQVRSGGRGKQGGVKQVKAAGELAAAVTTLFDSTFGGEKPDAVLIEPWLAIEREAYLSVAVDGRAEGYVVMYAPRGGIDIEEGAAARRATRSARRGISACTSCAKCSRTSSPITSGARK